MCCMSYQIYVYLNYISWIKYRYHLQNNYDKYNFAKVEFFLQTFFSLSIILHEYINIYIDTIIQLA